MGEPSVIIVGGGSLPDEAAAPAGLPRVATVKQLLEVSGRTPPGCVLIDVPDAEAARDLCRRLSEESHLGETAVVLVADPPDVPDLAASLADLPADDIVFRPIGLESALATAALAAERRRASRTLSPSAALLPQRVLNDILDGTPVAMFVIDVDHRVTYWNRACEELTGVRRRDVMGRRIDGGIFYEGRPHPLLAEIVVDGDFDALHRLYNGKGVTVCTHIRGAYEATDDLVMRGRRRTVSFLAAVIRNADGEVTGAIETLQDISEQRQAEMRLSQYQQRLRMLASELSLVERRERRELAAALHDGVGQSLFAVKAKAALMQDLGLDGRQGELLRQMLEQIDHTIQDARTLTVELCPPLLYEVGLAAALKWLTEQFGKRTGIAAAFVGEGVRDHLDDDCRAALFHSARELLINVERHARAGRVDVTVDSRDGTLYVGVRDDGCGLNPSSARHESHDAAAGFGLFSIRERLVALGGLVQIDSRPGGGTLVMLAMPDHASPAGEGR
ncbi:MAG: PAS domain-containing protein [Phycisphaerae bacterium]|nr:PAS domain-containing protein [Phycisphaerae bacterium]